MKNIFIAIAILMLVPFMIFVEISLGEFISYKGVEVKLHVFSFESYMYNKHVLPFYG